MLLFRPTSYKTLLFEVVAIFIGISASFWVENYREELQEDAIRQDILELVYLNLYEDSLILNSYLKAIDINKDWYIEDIGRLPVEQLRDSALTNTLSFMVTFLRFHPTRSGYEKMINSNVELMLPRELSQAINYVYNNDYLDYQYWTDLTQKERDKRTTLLQQNGFYREWKLDVTTYDESRKSSLRRMIESPDFQALYHERYFNLLVWQESHRDYQKRTSILSKALKAYYQEEFGSGIDPPATDIFQDTLP